MLAITDAGCRAFLVFTLLLVASLAIESVDNVLALFHFSFPGFPAGIAVWGLLVLSKRALE